MDYISLDLEWNQAYPEQLEAVQKRLGTRLRGEVIQIGAVKLDANMKIVGSYSVIVRPRFFKHINRHVARLTGITQDMIDLGVPLPEASERFKRWCGEDYAFLTWGPDDIPMLEDNFRAQGVDGGWLRRVYDLQKIYNRQTDGSHKQRSLEFVMEQFGLPQNLPAHDALNDAYFTALVAQKLDVPAGVADYDRTSDLSDGVLLSDVSGDADVGAAGYRTAYEAVHDPAVCEPTCPLCGASLEFPERMVHVKGQKYLKMMVCPEHGKLLLDLRISRNLNETFRVRRTVRTLDEETEAKIRARLTEEAGSGRPRRRRRRPRAEFRENAVAAAREESGENE